jgi:hypothetical protein
MFSMLSRRATRTTTLLALSKVLPRRQSADRDKCVSDDRPSLTMRTSATTTSCSTAPSLARLSCHFVAYSYSTIFRRT